MQSVSFKGTLHGVEDTKNLPEVCGGEKEKVLQCYLWIKQFRSRSH